MHDRVYLFSIDPAVQFGSKPAIKTENIKNPAGTGTLTVTKQVTGNASDKAREWHFTITLSDDSINGTYGDMDFTDGVAQITLKHGESKTARDLPAGITYTVTEQEAGKDGYQTTSKGETGSITVGGNSQADFVNRKHKEDPPVIEESEEDPDTQPEETLPNPPTETSTLQELMETLPAEEETVSDKDVISALNTDVNTGDSSSVMVYVFSMIGAMLFLGELLTRRRRKK